MPAEIQGEGRGKADDVTQTPLYIPDDAELDVSMWRQTDDRKVWYEWMVEVYCYVNGKRIRLGASDLHSSWKNGCLM